MHPYLILFASLAACRLYLLLESAIAFSWLKAFSLFPVIM
jgi:hypothetical protein